MEEDDKWCPMIRTGVSGWVFLLVRAYPRCPGPKALKMVVCVLSGTTWVGRYHKGKTNLDFTEARDSEWQWHQLVHMQVCTLLQVDNHASTPPLSFFYSLDALPAAQPTASKHWRQLLFTVTHTHTHTRLTALCLGPPGWAGTRKIKPIWILLKQETVSGSGIHWAICKSGPRSRQITMPAPHRSVFYRPDALPAAQPTVSKHWRQILFFYLLSLYCHLTNIWFLVFLYAYETEWEFSSIQFSLFQ